MQFKFDANQEFQLQAIEPVAGLLEGQPCLENEVNFSLGANRLSSPTVSHQSNENK